MARSCLSSFEEFLGMHVTCSNLTCTEQHDTDPSEAQGHGVPKTHTECLYVNMGKGVPVPFVGSSSLECYHKEAHIGPGWHEREPSWISIGSRVA